MKQVSFTRKKLYDLIWSTPLSQVAKTYNLTDNELRKRCKEFSIPIPYNGYWQKLKYNKPVHKIALAPIADETKMIVLNTVDSTQQFSTKSTIHGILNDSKAPIIVPSTLNKPHFLTSETKRHWADFQLKRYDYDRSIPYLSIRVEQPNRKRVLLFMDTLVKLIEYRGHKVIIQRGDTVAILYEVEIPLDLREAGKRIPNPPGSYPTFEVISTGEFILKTGKYSIDKEWRDGKVLLEDLLPKIVLWMEEKALAWAEMIKKVRLKQQEDKQLEEIVATKKALQEQELQSFQQLLQDSDRFAKAKELRLYIEALKENAIEKGCLTEYMQNYIRWATEKADWYDPLFNSEDSFLG
ncbi:MAG: hypothetical protein DI539_20660 [Flavobacterium psychrophilum]|nr:MAG: hypothetical protein DI539_20660 [Flavobacterium psychrophilum]